MRSYLGAFVICIALFSQAQSDETWNLPFDQKTAVTVFKSAQRDFLEKLEFEKLEQFLQRVSRGEQITEKQLHKFKKNRIRAQKLRAAYQFFDYRHATPPDFEEFIFMTGQLKDALSAGADARPLASRLLEFLNQITLEATLKDFSPTDMTSLNIYAESQFAKMEKWAAQEEVTIKKYHKIRKSLRSLYYVLKFLDLEGPEVEELIQSIKRLERKMGVIHDKLEEKKLLDKRIPETIELPVQTKEIIEKSHSLILKSSIRNPSCIGPLAVK